MDPRTPERYVHACLRELLAYPDVFQQLECNWTAGLGGYIHIQVRVGRTTYSRLDIHRSELETTIDLIGAIQVKIAKFVGDVLRSAPVPE